MEKRLERKIFNFKGKVDCITDSESRPGYKFVKLLSEQNQEFIGFAKKIPSYIKEGVTTKIFYKFDEDREYLIIGYTIP